MLKSARCLVLAVFLLAGANLAAAADAPDMEMGSARAKVTMIEYASLSCPHCAKFNNEVFPAFKKKYIDSGKVRYIYREFLTDPVEVAAMGALIARCAPRNRYFAVVDTIFKGQAEMYALGQAGPLLLKAGKAGGLDEAKVEACVGNQAAIDDLNTRVQTYAQRDNVHGTPTFVINGQALSGEQSIETLSGVIDPLLADKAAAR